MTRLLVLSDLHWEFNGWNSPAPCDLEAADVVVLAGDIGKGIRGIHWARDTFCKPVVYIAGNHEFYGGNWVSTLAKLRGAATEAGVHFLEDDAVVIDGVRFIGATLWTDFKLFGNERVYTAAAAAQREMNDFKKITFADATQFRNGLASTPRYRRLRPADAKTRFDISAAFIERTLNEPFDGKTVVVTHHLPHPRSIPDRYRNDELTAAYASDLSALIERFQPDLWIHGHVHDSFDYQVGRTRIVCNPRGYPSWGKPENPQFAPDVIVEL